MIHKDDVEVEYKFRVRDKEELIAVLDEKSDQKIPRQYQKNVMFDNPSKLMQVTNGRVRVRTRGDSGEKDLTYKRPLAPRNGAKREIEYEVKFTDPSNQIEKILEAIEFMSTTSYERYQAKWKIGDIHITLDEYPCADFIEIEGPRKRIESLAKELGFDIKDGLTKPVDTLFQEWREERGLSFKLHMRFNDFDK